MTQELCQAIAILQMPTQELLTYVQEQLEENPLLELEEDDPSQSCRRLSRIGPSIFAIPVISALYPGLTSPGRACLGQFPQP